jgi:hypothetical protein
MLGVVTHEWWRDEAYTWLVVGASGSVAELTRNLGFNGHPRAYYVLAWALHRLSDHPFALSIPNAAFGVAASLLAFRSAPFTRVQAILFSVGFYPLYQYGVVARSYSLLVLLLFAYCHLRATRLAAVVPRLLLLALLAQVHLMATVAAAVLLAVDCALGMRGHRWTRAGWAAAAIVVLSLALAAWQMTPDGGALSRLGAPTARAVAEGFANAFVPNFGVLHDSRVQRYVGFGVFLSTFAVLWQCRGALVVYGLLSGALAAVCVLVYVGHRWHHGLYFVFMVSALWLSSRPPVSGVRARVLTLILALHAAVGLYAVAADVLHPYSQGRLAAAFLSANGMERLPIVGMSTSRAPDGTEWYRWEIDQLQPLLVNLGRATVYDPVAETNERFYRHYARWDYFPHMTPGDIERSLAALASRFRGPFIVVAVATAPMNVPSLGRDLWASSEALDYGERYTLFVYPPEPVIRRAE